ncbi:hypothetical protein H0H93_008513 [Arthromyces matolae]|nr:hypothetical protein H0H93_008513 [Arthromyces matolae]
MTVSHDHILRLREIIPQAICVRYGLAIGARCSAFICAILWIFGEYYSDPHRYTSWALIEPPNFYAAPIAYPIAKFLDLALGGKENVTYNREEIKSFFELHCKSGHAQQEGIHDVEFDLINGVLDLRAKMAISFMKPIELAPLLQVHPTITCLQALDHL